MNRREFLTSVALASAATGLNCSWPFPDPHADAALQLAGFFDDSDDARRLGTEYLHRQVEERDLETLVGHLAGGLREISASPETPLHEVVHRRIVDEFEQGQTMRLGGWVFSRTEMRLYALSELSARARDRQSVRGMFPSEVVDRQRFRWTGPTAVFRVPHAQEGLDLRLRSVAPFEQRVTVLLDGRTIDYLALGDSAWHQFVLLLPCSAQRHLNEHASEQGRVPDSASCGDGDDMYQFELRTTPSWLPLNDFRTLGIQMGETPWTA